MFLLPSAVDVSYLSDAKHPLLISFLLFQNKHICTGFCRSTGGTGPASPNMPETLNGLHAWPGTPNMGMALQTKAVKENQRLAEEHGAVFFFSTRAMQLEQATDGRVTGVFAKSADGNIHLYRAARGVQRRNAGLDCLKCP